MRARFKQENRHFGYFLGISNFLGLNTSGFGPRKEKLCYLYFTFDIRASVGFGCLIFSIGVVMCNLIDNWSLSFWGALGIRSSANSFRRVKGVFAYNI